MLVLFLVTVTFDLDLQTRPSKGPNTSSLWIWCRSIQQFARYFMHKQKNHKLTVPKTEPSAVHLLLIQYWTQMYCTYDFCNADCIIHYVVYVSVCCGGVLFGLISTSWQAMMMDMWCCLISLSVKLSISLKHTMVCQSRYDPVFILSYVLLLCLRAIVFSQNKQSIA